MLHFKVSVHVQDASTAKLLVTLTHGSPNVLIDTPMLQLFDPIQACNFFFFSFVHLSKQI